MEYIFVLSGMFFASRDYIKFLNKQYPSERNDQASKTVSFVNSLIPYLNYGSTEWLIEGFINIDV